MRLYDSRTRGLQPLPVADGNLTIYVCGMTPSFNPHIGHARTFLTFDVLRRYVEASGVTVRHIQNVTDIDDRIIERAAAENLPWDELVEHYYGEYERCAARLGIIPPHDSPRATQHMPEIIEMIAALLAQGAAYESADGVYFAVEKFARYGRLSNRQVEDLRSGARIAVREDKRDPLDFALWKKRKAGEPAWPSPWGEGRPGWHIECSALARRYLGEQFDIHGGATDLIFPHHENEVAQTETFSGKEPLARIWMHAGLVMVDGQKMSKSLGNFIPLTALLERHPVGAIRYLFLQTGYRKPTNFTEGAIDGAAKGLRGMYADLQALSERVGAPSDHFEDHARRSAAALAQFNAFMDDDLNTAGALGWLQKTVRDARSLNTDLQSAAVVLNVVRSCLGVLGLAATAREAGFISEAAAVELSEPARAALRRIAGNGEPPNDISLIETVVALRSDARKAKDFTTSDRLRDALASAGVAIRDSKGGTSWSLTELPSP